MIGRCPAAPPKPAFLAEGVTNAARRRRSERGGAGQATAGSGTSAPATPA
jgi:hypothetical protein